MYVELSIIVHQKVAQTKVLDGTIHNVVAVAARRLLWAPLSNMSLPMIAVCGA